MMRTNEREEREQRSKASLSTIPGAAVKIKLVLYNI
jgi:hypothetical protein